MKRGIFVLVLLILLSSLTLASIDLSLDQEIFGPDQNLEGYLEIELEQALPKDTEIKLLVDGETYTKTLEEIFTLVEDETVIPPSYQKKSSQRTELILDFASEPYEKLIGIDLSEDEHLRQDIFQIEQFSLDIKGETPSPETPKINIGNDDTIEYTFIGSTLEDLALIEPTYLGDEIIMAEKSIRGTRKDIYCQKIKLHPTDKLQIRANVEKKVEQNDYLLKAAIVDLKENTLPECTENNCCNFRGKLNDINFVSYCMISQPEITEEKDYYVCVFMDEGDEATAYYNIGRDTDNTIKQGNYNFYQDTSDYFITAGWFTYYTKLTTSKTLSNLKDAANEYLQSCFTDDCLLMPIKITTDNRAKLKIENVYLELDTSKGMSNIKYFTKIEHSKEKIQYENKIKIPLSFFETALTPDDFGDYTIKATFNSESSETLDFEVKDIATIDIYYEPEEPTPGDLIKFTAETEPPEDRTIKSYLWDFGDQTTATLPTATHVFNEAKDYTVKLTVTDSEDIKATKSIQITLKPLEEVLEDKLNQTLTQVTEAKEKLTELEPHIKEAYDILGYTTSIEQALGNITLLKTQFDSLDLTLNISLTQMITINNKLTQIRDSIPDKVGSSKITFDSKINSLDKIPYASALNELDLENFQQKVFIAQKDIKADTDATLIKIQFLSNRIETFILIKKTITGTGTIYEIIPSSLPMKQVLTPNYEMISPAVYKWTGTNSINYILEVPEGLEQMALTQVTESRTLVLPLDLVGIQTPTTRPSTEVICGDGICSYTEDKESCPEDCEIKKLPWAIIALLAFILILGIYYFNLYNGPYNFKELIGQEQDPRMFKSKRDYYAIKQYVQSAKRKGLMDRQIKVSLRKKGWTNKQIQEGFRNSKK